MLLGEASVAVLITVVLTAPQIVNARSRTRIIPKIHDVWACRDKAHNFIIHNYTLLMDAHGGEYLTVEIELTKSMKSFTKMELIVHRCTGGVAANLCEYFTTWRWVTAICPLIMAKGAMWTPMIQQITPPVECPFKAGRYHSANATVDMDVLDKLVQVSGIEKYIWSVESKWYDGRELAICCRFTAEVRRIKTRD